MQPGNLVEITRASIGIPAGSLALILAQHNRHDHCGDYTLFTVKFVGNTKGSSTRRYLKRDLEVIS